MNIKDLLKEDSIILDTTATNKEEAIQEMVAKHYQCGHIQNQDIYYQAILEREKLSSTGIGHFIAIPHAQSETVNYPSLVAMVSPKGIEYDSLDQKPVHLLFMIAVPKEAGSKHLEILAQLCQILMDEKIVDQLIHSSHEKEFLSILCHDLEKKEDQKEESKELDIVAVTACPTGIAHTYIAEKALIEKAKEMNISIKVETNGASGIQNTLTKEDIQKARCVIVAADKKVEMERFHHKPLIQVPVTEAIYHTEELLQKAMSSNIEVYQSSGQNQEISEKGIRRIYQHLMSGISQIIPILMISGIFISLIPHIQNMGIESEYLTLIYYIATLAINIAIPIMSAFISDSIAGKPAFIVSLVSSILLINMQGNVIEGIILGYIAGYFVLGLSRVLKYLPKDFQSLSPNLFIPLIGSFVMGVIIYLTSPYFASYISLITQELNPVMLIFIGALLGIMMSIDLGGPINKTAYTIGIIGIFIGRYDLMSAVMLTGMLPPLIIWLTMLITHIFNDEERKQKWSCLFNGLCFVSEAAIPYMQKNKYTIHYPCIVASAIAGALTMYFGCSQAFPHGGIWTIMFINQPLYFVFSLVLSTVIGTLFIIFTKYLLSHFHKTRVES